MHDNVTVLGTIDASLKPIIDTERNLIVCRWLSLVAVATGQAHVIEGRGRNIRTIIDLIADARIADAASFIEHSGGVVVIVGL